jgi:hypothetical protein
VEAATNVDLHVAAGEVALRGDAAPELCLEPVAVAQFPGPGRDRARRFDVVADNDAAVDDADDGHAFLGRLGRVVLVVDPPAADESGAGPGGRGDSCSSNQDAACGDASGGSDDLPPVER